MITGGYAGIGLELSKLLLRDGWRDAGRAGGSDQRVGAGMRTAIRWLLVPLLFALPKKGADLVYQGAIDPKFQRQTGICSSGGKITKQSVDVVSIDMQKQLLALCQELTGI